MSPEPQRRVAGSEAVNLLIRIAIVESDWLVAEALEAVFSRQADMVVIAKLGSVAETAIRAKELKPDIAILDFRLDDGTAVDAARAMGRAGSGTKTVFLAGDKSDTVLLAAIEVGASAVLCKSGPAADVLGAVRSVAHGATLIHPGDVAALLMQRRVLHDPHKKLTHREKVVLDLVAEGIASREIADRLGISYFTVRTHLRNVACKLAAHSKLEVLVKARQLELLL
jgi:two-component system, NarL family, response regulator DevR